MASKETARENSSKDTRRRQNDPPYVDVGEFTSAEKETTKAPEGFVDMDEFAPKTKPFSARVQEEEERREQEAEGPMQTAVEKETERRLDPLGFLRPEEGSEPSFMRDVVLKTMADIGAIPGALARGVATSPRPIFESAQAHHEASQRAKEQMMEELKDPDYVTPLAKKKYPITDDMSEEEKEEQRKKRKAETAHYKRTEEARGGEEAIREDLKRIEKATANIKKWKEKFPERAKEFENLAEAAAYSIGEFAPGMLALMGSGGVGGFLTNYTSLHGILYDQYRQAGAAKDKAHEAAQIAASLSGLIETGGTAVTLGSIGKIMGKMLPKVGVNAQKAGKIRSALSDMGSVAAPGITESTEEFLQQYPEEFGMVLANAPDDISSEELLERFQTRIASEEFRKEQAYAWATGGLAGTMMAVVPAGGRAAGQRIQRRRETIRRKDRAKAEAARTRLQDAYQRKEGDQGLSSEHKLAQQNLDLYNMLYQPQGSIFEQMEAKAKAKELREAQILQRAEEIQAEREGREPRKTKRAKRRERKRRAEEAAEETEAREPTEEELDALASHIYDDTAEETITDEEVEAEEARAAEIEQPAEERPAREESLVERYRATRGRQQRQQEIETAQAPEQETELEGGIETETSDKFSPKESADILTKKGEPFKTFRAARSSMTRQGLTETHDVVTREDGYAIRPKETDTTTEPEAAEEASVFEDIDILQREMQDIERGASESSTQEIGRALESIQEHTLASMALMDSADQKIAFIADNHTLTESENDRLAEIFQKEDSRTLTPEDAAERNVLLRKLVGKEPRTRANQEYDVFEPVAEEDENLFDLPSFFDTDPDAVETIRQAYSQRSMEQIKSNPETLLGYLTNQLNAWVHGIADPDIRSIKDTLNFLRDESNSMYEYFGSQVQLNEFVEALDNAIELAEKAPSLKSGGSGITLRVSFGLDLFYPAVKDVIGRVHKWRGKVHAAEALEMIREKRPAEADLFYPGVEEYLRKAAAEGRKVSKEEVLENAVKLPKVNVSFMPSSSGMVGGALRQLHQLKQMYAEGNVEESDFVSPELNVEEAAKAIGTDYETAASYIKGEMRLEQLLSVLYRQNIRPGGAAYEGFSVFQHTKPDQYEYEDMIITLPEYAYNPDDAYHSMFGAPVAFFARLSRSKDRFIVEEIQSELATIFAKKHKNIPSPYKQKGWVDLVTTMIAKRAKALGYNEVYFPTYKWVNTRWEGHLPKSARQIYDKMITKSMNKINASELGITELEDAFVSIANDQIRSAIITADKEARQILDSSRRVDEVLEENNLSESRTAKTILDHYRSYLNKMSSSEATDFFSRAADLLGKKSSVLRQLMDYMDTGDIRNIDLRYPSIAALLYADMRGEPGDPAITFAEGSPFLGMDSLYTAFRELASAYDLFLTTTESVPAHISDRLLPLQDRLINDNASSVSEEFIDDVITKLYAEVSEPVSEFRKFRLEDKEPDPQSISLTCNCGIDPTDIIRLVKRYAKRRGQKTSKEGKGSRVKDMYDNTEKELEKSLAKQASEIKSLIGTKILDVTRPMKQKLVKEFGEQAANRAITRIILAKGYTVRSSMFLSRAMKDTFGGLSQNKRNILNRIIFSSRLVQIGRYRRNIKDFKGISPQEHRDYLYNLEEREGISEGEALELFRRAERYFDYTLELLDVLREDGLITEEEYNELYTFRWTRTEALNKIDPMISGGVSSLGQPGGFRGKRTPSVRESGVEELEIGSELESPQIDMMYVLADWANRVMKRSSLSRMNKEVWNLANSQPKNKLLVPAKGNKRPPNWKTIEMVVEGKKRQIYAPPEFTRWWQLDEIPMKPETAQLIRTVSGSAILRPMATGIRLGFIPVNILRDLGLIWQASKYMGDDGKWKPVYNRLMPIAAGQMAWDMAKVTPAAVMKGKHKKYQDYINAGGGLSFMAVQGRPFEAAEMRTRFGSGTSYAWAKMKDHGDKLYDFLSYPLEVSEVLTRLMTVERSLKKIAKRENMSVEMARADKDLYAEAVGIAKDYLDFSQYGTWIKSFDHALPYFNATFQAGRSMVRAWRKDPRTAIIQHAQVMMLGALLALGRHNYMKDDDEEDRDIEQDITAYDLARNFIVFPFGKEMYFTDEFGNRHRPYLKIPVEGSLMLAKTLGELGVAAMTRREVRGDVISEAVRGSIPFQAAPMQIPLISALSKYFLNVDPYFKGKVWPHDELVKPEARITEDTPQMIKDFSEMMNRRLPDDARISPHNLYRALTSIGTNGNYLTHFFGYAYNRLRDVPEADREMILWESLAQHPTTSGLINFTRPDIARMEVMEEAEAEEVTKQHKPKYEITKESRELREIQRGMLEGNALRKERKILKHIEEFAGTDEDEYNRLFDIYRFYTEMPDTSRWSQWQSLAGKTPATRARMFKRMLDQTPPDKRDEVWAEVKQFPQVDSKDFWREYRKIIESQGR